MSRITAACEPRIRAGPEQSAEDVVSTMDIRERAQSLKEPLRQRAGGSKDDQPGNQPHPFRSFNLYH